MLCLALGESNQLSGAGAIRAENSAIDVQSRSGTNASLHASLATRSVGDFVEAAAASLAAPVLKPVAATFALISHPTSTTAALAAIHARPPTASMPTQSACPACADTRTATATTTAGIPTTAAVAATFARGALSASRASAKAAAARVSHGPIVDAMRSFDIPV